MCWGRPGVVRGPCRGHSAPGTAAWSPRHPSTWGSHSGCSTHPAPTPSGPHHPAGGSRQSPGKQVTLQAPGRLTAELLGAPTASPQMEGWTSRPAGELFPGDHSPTSPTTHSLSPFSHSGHGSDSGEELPEEGCGGGGPCPWGVGLRWDHILLWAGHCTGNNR